MIAGRELDLPAVTAADTPSLHGLLYISPLARLLEFVVGMTTCAAFRWVSENRRGAGVDFHSIGNRCPLLSWVGFDETYFVRAGNSPAAVNCGSILGHADAFPGIIPVIFIFAFQKGAISRVLSLKPLLFLEEASYSLYLVHFMTFAVIANFLGITGAIGFAFGCAASLALAFALWGWVETPARKTIRRKLKPAPTSLHACP
jgi:peptidoglycan/LPS O-acetylase OafA/YrhL